MDDFATVLGYVYPNYFIAPTGTNLVRCNAILTELATLDIKIAEAQDRIMATQVGDLTLDYGTQIYHWNRYASKLLEELSFRSGIPLVFNKYDTGNGTISFSGGSVF